MEDDPLGSSEIRTLPPIGTAALMSRSLTSRSKTLEPASKRKSESKARAALYSSPFTADVSSMRFDTSSLSSSQRRLVASQRSTKTMAPGASQTKLGTATFDYGLSMPARALFSPAATRDLGFFTTTTTTTTTKTTEPHSFEDGHERTAPPGVVVVKPGHRPLTYARSADEEALADAMRRIRTYQALLEEHALHHFIIWKGKRMEATPEFAAFRKRFATRWVAISKIVGLLEDVCLERSLLLALVDGEAVDALARCDYSRLKIADVLACVHNMDRVTAAEQVQPLPLTATSDRSRRRSLTSIHVAGGDQGIVIAEEDLNEERIQMVVYIQQCLRMRLDRLRYIDRLRRIAATTRITALVRGFLAVTAAFKMLAAKRQTDRVKWAALCQRLTDQAPLMRNAQAARVEVHLPSMSYSEHARLQRTHHRASFALTQAAQIARLCRARAANVHVVYVSPFPLDDETMAYYDRLLDLDEIVVLDDDNHHHHGGDAGSTTTTPAMRRRTTARQNFTIVVPENAGRFASHATLAAVALYSPACLRRIAALCASRFAYIVPAGPCGALERAVALQVDVPLFGPGPASGALYGSRSGAKRALRDADVNLPVGAHDIYDDDDFVVALAKLVAAQLDVGRWKFAVDCDAGASGVAYLDVDDVPVVRDLRKERRRLAAQLDGDTRRADETWRRADVQTLARSRLVRLLPAVLAVRAVVCYPGDRRTVGASEEEVEDGGDDDIHAWPGFAALLRRFGAVIEAEPRRIRGRPVAHATINPDGTAEVSACQDLIYNSRYEAIAAVWPAATAPETALVGATLALCRRLFKAGVIGHFSLHFVAYHTGGAATTTTTNTNNNNKAPLRLWATELELGLTAFATGHWLHSTVTAKPFAADASDAAYFLAPMLEHAGLGATKLPSFFKLCRLHGVAFDVDDRRGNVFLLLDSLAVATLGTLAEGRSRLDALNLAQRLFTFLKRHVTTHHVIYDAKPRHTDLDDLANAVQAELKALGMVRGPPAFS